MDREIIEKIIAAGVKAPSGDNLQPWSFRVQGNRVEVFAEEIHEQTSRYYDFKKRATYISHGSLLENISIAADHFGYYADIHLFPNNDERHIASIELREDSIDHGVDLYWCINKRLTNRNRYLRKELSDKEKQQLKNALTAVAQTSEVRFAAGSAEIQGLARRVALQEELIFSHRGLHTSFFSAIRWSPKEAQESKTGIDIRTLALSLADRMMMRLALKFWTVCRVGMYVGLHKYIAHKGAVRYRHSGAFGAIVLKKKPQSKEDHVEIGRMLERIWLTATRSDLSLQPAFAVGLLAGPVLDSQKTEYSKKQETALREAVQYIEKIFCAHESEKVAFMFRIGKAKKKPYPTVRKEPNIEWVS